MAFLRPKENLNSIFEINLYNLKKSGIDALIIDLDETLIPKDIHEFSFEILSWVEKAKSLGFKLCITSNSIRSRRVRKLAGKLGLPHLSMALKPFSKAFNSALKMLGSVPEETAIIGDQLFTDVLGGNLHGIYTIRVKPMTGEKVFLRKILRLIENLLMNRF